MFMVVFKKGIKIFLLVTIQGGKKANISERDIKNGYLENFFSIPTIFKVRKDKSLSNATVHFIYKESKLRAGWWWWWWWW